MIALRPCCLGLGRTSSWGLRPTGHEPCPTPESHNYTGWVRERREGLPLGTSEAGLILNSGDYRPFSSSASWWPRALLIRANAQIEAAFLPNSTCDNCDVVSSVRSES